MTDVEEFLAHHGVKGMKWGVRKSYAKRNARRKEAARSLIESKKTKIERGREARENRPRPLKNMDPATRKKIVAATVATGAVVSMGILAARGSKTLNLQDTRSYLKDRAWRTYKKTADYESSWAPVTEADIQQTLKDRATEVAYWTNKFTNLPD